MSTKKTAIAAIAALACVSFLFCAAGAKLAAQTPPPLRLADALAKPIVTVTDKPDSPTAGKHDYVSYAPCYWPDPAKPGGLPYVLRDGDENSAQVARGDRARLQTFFDTVDTLATAWRSDHNTAAAKRAGDWLRAWLVSPATRMNPSLDYAQIRPGSGGDRGTPDGIIEARDFGRIAANIADLDKSPALTDPDKAAIRSWFDIYLDWLLSSKNGAAERAARDSHGTWFAAQALPIAIHVGRDSLARALADETKKNMARQIARDGSQPEELRGANTLGSSLSNIEAYARLAKAAAAIDTDLWNYVTAGHSSLSRAVDFLAPYNKTPSKWPLPQKTPMQPGFLDALIKERDAQVKPDGPVAAMPPLTPTAPTAPALAPATATAFGTASGSATNATTNAAQQTEPPAPPAQAAPTAPAAPPPPPAPPITSIVIIIQKDGGIVLNGQQTTGEQIAEVLAQTKAASRYIPVFISMDESAPVQTLAAIMDACRAEGFRKFSVQTQ